MLCCDGDRVCSTTTETTANAERRNGGSSGPEATKLHESHDHNAQDEDAAHLSDDGDELDGL